MNLKKLKIINVVLEFALSFLWHFTYDLIPNFYIGLFFPVNESIWEHMKIIYGVIIVASLIELVIANKNKIKLNNFYIETMFKSTFAIIFYLAIFVPIYLLIGENMFIAIGLMLLTYIIVEYLSIKINNNEELNIKVLPLVIITLIFILFALLTVYPIHNFLFFDSVKYGYGFLK